MCDAFSRFHKDAQMAVPEVLRVVGAVPFPACRGSSFCFHKQPLALRCHPAIGGAVVSAPKHTSAIRFTPCPPYVRYCDTLYQRQLPGFLRSAEEPLQLVRML